MWQSLAVTAAALALAVSAAGCTAAAGEGAPPVPPQREIPMNQPPASVAEAVLADAAKRTGMARASLVLESVQAVTWSDGSLGCPQPGMNYTMALVPGYRIRVRAGEQLLDYHASRRGYFVLCPEGRAVDPLGSTDS
jgi:hypothetical protein